MGAGMQDFFPPNSFRWRWTEVHNHPAILAERKNDPSCSFTVMLVNKNETAIENVRKQCVEFDKIAKMKKAFA